MRNTGFSVVGLLVVALSAGCPSKDEESGKQPDTAAEHLDKARSEAGEAARAVKDYTYAQKDELVAQMREELARLEAELTRLSAKVDRADGAAKAEALDKLDVVREKWTQAKKQVDQMELATESTWESAKSRFEQSYEGLRASVKDSRQWLSDKIDP